LTKGISVFHFVDLELCFIFEDIFPDGGEGSSNSGISPGFEGEENLGEGVVDKFETGGQGGEVGFKLFLEFLLLIEVLLIEAAQM
jgi:hypothetical protein